MSNATKNASEILKAITENPPAVEDVRFIRTIQEGQAVRQGDVMLLRVSDNHKRGKVLPNTGSLQLAPGNTKGSRHVAEGSFEAFETHDSSDPLAGPVIHAKERIDVTHPEHADISLPSGTYRVGYQLDPRTMRRVAD